MILTPEPPSNNTSSIIFSPICAWIIAIWLSIAIVVVLASSTKEPTCFFVVLASIEHISLTHELF